MASLVERLKKAKANLQAVETKILTCDGQEIVEKRNPDGSYKSCNVGIRPWGFIGDIRPDLQAGKVCEQLYVGSQDVAGDLEMLRLLGITHILNVATYVPNYYSDSIQYKNISLVDLPSADIKTHLPDALGFIEGAIMSSGGTVLVHCNAGVSRSTTIVAAYLMQLEGLSASAAVERVKAVRPAARPNDGFLQQLKEFEDELHGRKQAAPKIGDGPQEKLAG